VALRSVFELEGISAEPFAPCCDRVQTNQRALVTDLGLA
jgi:hypothetical protein